VSAWILAIDTTGEVGSIALARGSEVIEEVEIASADGFAHVLFGEIEALLARHGVTLSDIDGFASASGPGSFTCVRVGLTAVKGLAEATGRKVVAVSNLQALASLGTRALRAPVIDARRGEIYGAVYDASLKLVQDEIVMPYAAWVEGLPVDVEIIKVGQAVPPAHLPLAAAIARIAAGQFSRGLGRDPADIDANYVRRSDAELLWKDPAAR
jgi:tRNA threonylcarbamoyladenosine biosynthesis protein TsaB